MEGNEFVIDGICFPNQFEYNKAKEEAENIAYIKANTNLNDVKKLLKLYHKLIEKKPFQTTIGLSFLMELRNKILSKGIMKDEYLPSIPMELFLVKQESDNMRELKDMNIKKLQQTSNKYKQKVRNYRIITVGLIAVIASMFVLAITNDKTAYENYKIEVTDEYASWDEDLRIKENILDLKEKELEQWEVKLREMQETWEELNMQEEADVQAGTEVQEDIEDNEN